MGSIANSSVILVAVIMSTMAQRSFYAGIHSIYDDVPNNQVDDTDNSSIMTTEWLPAETRGDYQLIDEEFIEYFDPLPFWLYNSRASERKQRHPIAHTHRNSYVDSCSGVGLKGGLC